MREYLEEGGAPAAPRNRLSASVLAEAGTSVASGRRRPSVGWLQPCDRAAMSSAREPQSIRARLPRRVGRQVPKTGVCVHSTSKPPRRRGLPRAHRRVYPPICVHTDTRASCIHDACGLSPLVPTSCPPHAPASPNQAPASREASGSGSSNGGALRLLSEIRGFAVPAERISVVPDEVLDLDVGASSAASLVARGVCCWSL